ncbi:hypothetical protein H0H93_002050 [Arthromyces matolae]|nr:hypothetical protein H0H93_002050 [Arthromyces matolae]
MAWKSFLVFHPTSWLLLAQQLTAQTISTDTPVPPLQWINLSGLLQGSSSPPPLKNAAIGYDDTRLNLDSLTWSVPTPPDNLQRTPVARSAAIFGTDFAASKFALKSSVILYCSDLHPHFSRHGFIVAGGKGSDGSGLADIWEYDFINQFWSEVNVSPGSPLPRWGAGGGIDSSTAPIQDLSVPGPNNTFYLSGGYDGHDADSLSDIWRFNVSGTLSSNLPDDVNGSWDHLKIGNLPAKVNVSSAVIGHQVVLTGGCSSPSVNGTCADQDTYIIDAQQQSGTTFSVCPAPRTSPVLVRNFNQFTSTFASQIYLLLGTVDTAQWDDGGGHNEGEVAILDVEAGTWSRILPSGDPGTSGQVTYPSPREGAIALSYAKALVGQNRNLSSDTLIFGGQDASGKVLSEMWLLRAYNGLITPTQTTWSGFGDGRLQTGVNASGAGVSVKYMTQCASEIILSASSTTNPTASPTTSNFPSASSSPFSSTFRTSAAHKALSPVSLAIFQSAFIVFRSASSRPNDMVLNVQAIYSSAVLLLLAYGSGIAGLIIAFLSTSSTEGSTPRSSFHLRTSHGIAGLILFTLLYIMLPLVLILYRYLSRGPATVSRSENEKHDSTWTSSPESPEPLQTYDRPPSRSAPQSLRLDASSLSSPRHRANSWDPSSTIQRSRESRMSSDSDSVHSPSPKRGFEVVNRPQRIRRTSMLAGPPADSQDRLRDIDWLQRRRSLNAVGELDYALTQVRREQLSTPATTDGLMAVTSPHSTHSRPVRVTMTETILYATIQGLFLGLSIVTLVILWMENPRYGFAIFLAWTVLFYVINITFAIRHSKDSSFIAVFCGARNSTAKNNSPDISPVPLPEIASGVYVHQPLHRLAPTVDDVSLSQGPRSAEADEDDDDVDDDTRQRIIEEEMGRRDVSIVTVPKRKLWIANP